MKRSHLTLFAASFGVASVLGYATQTEALFTRMHASHCLSRGEPNFAGFDVNNFDSGVAMTLECAHNDDDRFPHTSVVAINVHGFDGNNDGAPNGAVIAKACRTDAFATSGSCSVASQTSDLGTGHFTLTPSPAGQWGTSSDFVFTAITVPYKDGNSLSRVRGVFTSN